MELTTRIREIYNMMEEAYDTQDWSIIQECFDHLDTLYDLVETNSGDYDLDME